MVPAAYVVLEMLPLTPNGKLDRQALPAPGQPALGQKRSWQGRALRRKSCWPACGRRCCAVERVGAEDNFFELGGHSLLATQVVSRLRKLFQVELPPRQLFEAPTVAGLAQAVEAARHAEQGGTAPPLQPAARDGALPLSFAQQRLWFIDQLEPDSPRYNVPAALCLSGTLDVAALEQSLNAVVQRHEALRTTFAAVQGRAVQVIAPSLNVPLPVADLGVLTQAERAAEAQRLAQAEARQPFDLARGPLLRARLLRLGEQEHWLLLTMHHIVSDGWSMGVLQSELGTLYQALSSGRAATLAELPVQYADFAQWQRQWLQGEALAAQLAYWRKQLEGAPGGAGVAHRSAAAGGAELPRGLPRRWRCPGLCRNSCRR